MGNYIININRGNYESELRCLLCKIAPLLSVSEEQFHNLGFTIKL